MHEGGEGQRGRPDRFVRLLKWLHDRAPTRRQQQQQQQRRKRKKKTDMKKRKKKTTKKKKKKKTKKKTKKKAHWKVAKEYVPLLDKEETMER